MPKLMPIGGRIIVTATRRTGFDAPASLDADVLERQSFARRVYELIKETPADWSVRIGVYGPWGSGKSTVLGFVEELVVADGNIPIRFNPWRYVNREAMFAGLLREVGRAAEQRAGVKVPGLQRAYAEIVAWAASSGLAEEVVGAFNEGAGKIVSRARSFFTRVPPQAAARVLPPAAGAPRVVVLIDDLDRTDPRSVPALLWALRELLDDSGFAFVMAIDPERLGQLVTQQHGIEDGKDFLEKIIDFPWHLPPPSRARLFQMMKRDLGRWCPRLSTDALDAVTELLPAHPRRVRLLARQLLTLRATLERFGDDELDPVAVLQSHILRTQWPSLARAIAADAEALVRSYGGVRFRLSSKDEDAEAAFAKVLGELVERASVAEHERAHAIAVTRAMLETLVLAREEMVVQLLTLDQSPPALTIREFRELFLPLKQADAVVLAAQKHAAYVGLGTRDVLSAVAVAATDAHHALLEQAANVDDHATLTHLVAQAAAAVDLLRTLFVEGAVVRVTGTLSADNIEQALVVALRWAHFDNLPEYRALRAKEMALADDVLHGDQYAVTAAFDSVRKRFDDPSMRRNRPVSAVSKLGDWLRVLHRRLLEELIASVRKPDGVRTLRSALGGDALDSFLVDPRAGKVFEASLAAFDALALAAASDANVQRNLLFILALINQCVEKPHLRMGAGGLVSNPRIVEAIWRGSVAARLNPRIVGSLRQDLSTFASVWPDVHFVLPPWWATVVAELDRIRDEADTQSADLDDD